MPDQTTPYRAQATAPAQDLKELATHQFERLSDKTTNKLLRVLHLVACFPLGGVRRQQPCRLVADALRRNGPII